MRPPSAALDPHDGCYFERPPERLVLEGYRRWLAGYDSGSVTPWEMTQALYEELLGAAEGRRVLAELSHFVRTLRQCAACPLQKLSVRRAPCLPRRMRGARTDRRTSARGPGRHRNLPCRRSPVRRARPTSPRRRPASPTRWPAPGTTFCQFRKARSKTCFHVPAPNAAPFTEETRMTTTLSRARLSGRLTAIAASTALTAAIFVLPAKADTDPQAVIVHLRRHRARQVRGLA